MSFPFLDETRELNEITRKDLGGSFIPLSDGVTHYQLGGDKNGSAVVMVHGFSVPYFIFDTTYEFLARSGFRTLRYDLLGRGFSDRPNLRYDIHLFVRQLKDLLDALNLNRVSVIGLSMGGPVTTAFIDKYPDRVEKHVLIDPAGAKPIALSRPLQVTKIPGVGELLLGLFGSRSMIRNIASDFFDPELVSHFQERYKVQLHYKGFKRAILSTLRNGMLGSFMEYYQRVGKLNKPTLLVWGKNDTTVPFTDSGLILGAIPRAKFHALEACGHIPHFEKPGVFNPILLEFLKAS